MLSRVADSIYWLARYIERAENSARIVMVNANMVLDTPKGMSPGWRPLITITSSEELYDQNYSEDSERNVVKFLIGDMNNPGSILSSLWFARENVRTIRDVVPRETWESINDLHLYAKTNLRNGLSQRARYDYLKHIIAGAQQITGMLAGTMNHDTAYHFLRIGRNLERAEMTIRIIDVRSASLLPHKAELTPFENIQWMSVLKSLSGYQMYRRLMQVRVGRPAVLKFLLQTREFPRAFFHCICEVEESMRRLPHNNKTLAILAAIKETVLKADLAQLEQQALHIFIDDLELALADLTTQINNRYFVAEPSPIKQSG
ncbi:alpha-E domain-containing protein [Sulfurirhabdus autotrophica]|uniref:Putative alpha-E superfamily protein n=1 Tax=Sulfurirhabdus autotrophica TaxID=1706046 RepID=A0A4R3XRS3_9PROT|nr:alpha-E domain-containing protein [Sulfurirhabdus autotrophica]TCV79280.1 putative alpha-E superfamily protein [Sulfurirhabdus autotrophica]